MVLVILVKAREEVLGRLAREEELRVRVSLFENDCLAGRASRVLYIVNGYDY